VRENDNFFVRAIKRLYEPTLRLVMRRPWLIAVSTVIWTALSVLAFLKLGAEFVPKLDEGSHTVMLYRTNSMNH
jgi:cobalt-zinc-cadmium resistance protein CzcA